MESDIAVVKNTCENELEFGCVSSLVNFIVFIDTKQIQAYYFAFDLHALTLE